MGVEKPKITCLFVHGWGMNYAVWQSVIGCLPPWIDAQCMDLPGHGHRNAETLTGLQALADDVQAHCNRVKKADQPLILMAWSLGALPCLQLCINHYKVVDGLMVVNASPCFVVKPDWPLGVDGAVFDAFAVSLKKDFTATIRRFLSLQVKGSTSSRHVLRDLRETIMQQPIPNTQSLEAGLVLLKQIDLRQQLLSIQLPVCWLLGEQDGLVNTELADKLNVLIPQAEVITYKSAGHAVFLSHGKQFVQQLIKFCQYLSDD